MEQRSTALQRLARRRRRIGQLGAAAALLVLGLFLSVHWWDRPKDRPKPAPLVWTTLLSPTGHFSVMMPGTPPEQKRVLAFLNQPLAIHVYESESAETTCMAGFADFPSGALAALSPDELLTASRPLYEVIDSAKLLDEHPAPYQQFPGRERRLETSSTLNPQRAILRVYLVHGRMFHLAACGTKSFDELSQSATKLFESFQVIVDK